MLSLVFAMAAQTAAPAVAVPVEYERAGGSGTLTITPGPNGLRRFGLSTFGANAHTCELGGTIKDNIGTLYDNEPGQPQCRISFRQRGDVIDVTAVSYEACMGLCGARATFEGKYQLPPEACKQAAARSTRERFGALYKAKQYQQAYDTLHGWFVQCSGLLHWMEADRARNDMAITQYHLKRPAACLQTLSATYAAPLKSMAAVEEDLPPMDFEAYASTAKATFHNLKLCAK